MEIKKIFIQNCFDKSIELFEQKIMKLPVKIELEFLDIGRFIEHAKASSMIKYQIQFGVYKNIEKELPSCMCVLEHNKSLMRQALGLPFVISISLDITKRILKPYNKKQCTEYLIHGFIHELTHVFEGKIIEERKDIWEKSLEDSNGLIEFAKEHFAENIASLVSINQKNCDKMQEEIWHDVYEKMKKYAEKRR